MAEVHLDIVITEKGEAIVNGVAQKLDQVADKTDKATKQAGFFETVWQGIGQGIGQRVFDTLLEGLEFLADGFVDLTTRGAEVSSLGDSFDFLTARVNETGDAMLQAGKTGAHGLITDMDLMKAANKALLLELPLTAGGFKTLSEASVVLGNAIGGEGGPAAVFEKLTQAVGAGQEKLLKQAGLEIDLERVTKVYAGTLGKKVEQLTEAEKKQALYNATVAAAAAVVREAGGVQLGFGENLQRMQVSMDNAMDSIGRAIVESPALVTILDLIADGVESLSEFIIDNEDNIRSWVDQGILFAVGAVRGLIDAIDLVLEVLEPLSFMWATQSEGVVLLGQNVDIMAGLLDGVTTGLDDVKQAMEGTRIIIDIFRAAWIGLGEVAAGAAAKLVGVGAQLAALAKQDELARSLGETEAALAGMAATLDKQGHALTSNLGAQRDAGQVTDQWRAKLDALEKKLRDAIAANDGHGSSLKRVKKDTDEATGATVKLTEAEKVLLEVSQRIPDVMQELFDQQLKLTQAKQEDADISAQLRREIDAHNLAMEQQKLTVALLTGEFDDLLALIPRVGSAGGAVAELLAKFTDLPPVVEKTSQAWGDLSRKLEDIAGVADAVTGLMETLGVSSENAALVSVAAWADMAAAAAQTAAAIQSGDIAGAIIGGIKTVAATINFGKALHDLFTSSPAEKAAKEAGRIIGSKVSEEMGQEIVDRAKALGISIEDSILLSITRLAEEGGKSIDDIIDDVDRLMEHVADGSIPAREGIEELGNAFEMAKEQGGKAMIEMIQRAHDLGVQVPAIAEHVRESLRTAFEGLDSIIGNLPLGSPEDITSQAQLISATFWATMREHGLVAAADTFKDLMGRWNEALEEAGLEMSAEAAALLFPINDIIGLLGDETMGPIIRGFEGLQGVLGGLADSGYLTAQAFEAIQQQGASAFEKLVAAGATEQQALAAIAPLLADVQREAERYGFHLDDATQALIDQAEAAGIAFPKEPMEVMVDLLGQIVELLGGHVPRAAQDARRGVEDAFAGIEIEIPIHARYDEEFPGDGPEHFAVGGIVTRPTFAMIGEGGGAEVVAPVQALFGQLGDAMTSRILAGLSSMGGGGGGPVVVNVEVIVAGDKVDGVIARRKDAGYYDLR